MQKISIIILLFICTLTAKSQSIFTISTFGAYSKKDIQKDLRKEIKKVTKKNIPNSLVESTNGDTLTYNIHDSINGYELKFTFKIKQEYVDNVYCDYQNYIFDCTPCSQKALKEVIKSYGFRKQSENIYLSNYLWKTEMTVVYKNGTSGCLNIEFRHVNKTKKEYKAIYNALPKI